MKHTNYFQGSFFVKFFLTSFIFLIISYSSIAQNLKLKYIDVSQNVVMLNNEKSVGSNMTCISLDDGLVFVDCSLFTEIASTFRSEMEKRFNKKTIALILTHAHTDHFFGMGAFKDVNVIASIKSKKYFNYQLGIDFKQHLKAYEGVFPRFEEALNSSDLFTPSIWANQELHIGNHDNYLIFRQCGGHTSGSAYIYFPSDNIIIAGDNLQVDYHPYFGDKTGDINDWIKALNDWEKLKPVKLCPGHGKPVDLLYLTKTKIYFEKLMNALTELKSKDVKIEDVVKHESLPEGYWPSELVKPGWFDYSIGILYNKIKE